MSEGKDLQTVVGYLSPVKQGVNYPFSKYLKKYARQKLAVKMKNISMSPGFTENKK